MATEMPQYGPVPGPGYDHPPEGGADMGQPPGHKWKFAKPTGPQIHKAAGGPDRWYIDLEDIIWAVRSASIPFPLITASPPAAAGILGQEGTRVLFGDNNLHYGRELHVFRLTGGVWDSDHRCGLELSGFIQEHRGEFADFALTSANQEALARPVIDALTGQGTALLVSFPGAFSGEAHVAAHIKLGGAEANLLRSLVYCDRFKLNLLAGIRYVDLDEDLSIISRSFFPSIDPLLPNITDVVDSFGTRNQFVGANLGFQSEFRRGRYFVDLTGKVALGNMNSRLSVQGFTNTDVNGATNTVQGG
jgi:hypothetical protein